MLGSPDAVMHAQATRDGGEDATLQVAHECFVYGQCVAPCGKQILRRYSYSSARGNLGTAAERGLDRQPLKGLLAIVRWKQCRAAEVAAHPPHCPVPLTAPGSSPAPNDSHLSPSLPTSSHKPTIISLFFSSPLLLHPSGGPQYTLALAFPFLSIPSFIPTHS